MENIKFSIQGYLLKKDNMSDFFGFVPLKNLKLPTCLVLHQE